MTFKKEILHLFDIIAAPTEVYLDINEDPRWRCPVAFLFLSSTIVGWFMIPATLEIMRKIFSSSFGEQGADAAIAGVMKSLLVLHLLFDPASVLLRWVTLACILYASSLFFVKGDVKAFKRVCSAIAYTETIPILMNILTVLIIYVRGLQAIEGNDDLTIFKGLDFVFKGKHLNPTVSAFLSNLHLFSLWHAATLSLSVRIIMKAQAATALLISLIGWFVVIALSLLLSEVKGLLMGYLF